jgi:hypothetical protein
MEMCNASMTKGTATATAEQCSSGVHGNVNFNAGNPKVAGGFGREDKQTGVMYGVVQSLTASRESCHLSSIHSSSVAIILVQMGLPSSSSQ